MKKIIPIILIPLLCAIASGCATSKTKPPSDPDLRLSWSVGSSGQERKITSLKKCSHKTCTDVPFQTMEIWLKAKGTQPQKNDVEVCHDSSNPFIQHCELYDCYEDHAAQQSVCDFVYDYNKNCMSEQCSN